MELCETCKNNNCSKKIIEKEENGLKTIKCFEYEKDQDKIQSYKKPLERTAEFSKSVMGLYNPSWDQEEFMTIGEIIKCKDKETYKRLVKMLGSKKR